MTKKALVVFSGGQDSTTCLFLAIKTWGLNNVYAITFDYNQRHQIEISAAIKICTMAGVRHTLIDVPDILQSTSPLTDPNAPLEQYANHDEMADIIGDRIEKTFVPMRNPFFLTLAANHAVAMDCSVLVTGVCEDDNANYPDCTEKFIVSQQHTINHALGRTDFAISTPLIHLSKARSITLAKTLPGCMEALAFSHTAYDGSYPPSGADHATVLRAQGFFEADTPDPLIIRAWHEDLMPLPTTSNYDRIRDTTS